MLRPLYGSLPKVIAALLLLVKTLLCCGLSYFSVEGLCEVRPSLLSAVWSESGVDLSFP
jgi:hypothetical protein